MIEWASIPAASRRLATAWFVLALAAFGLSLLFAVVLVGARTPFLGFGAGLFRTALVLHVDFAVLVWFLAVAAGIWTMAGTLNGKLVWIGWTSFALSVLGVMTMVAVPLTSDAAPILSNYVPLLDHVHFLYGMAFFAVGVCVTALLGLPAIRYQAGEPWRLAASGSMVVLLVSAFVLVLGFRDLWQSPGSADALRVALDDRLWGVGHVLQFVHVLLLMGVWCVLGAEALDKVPAVRRAAPGLLVLATLPALVAAGIALVYPVGAAEYRAGFTNLMRWGSWPAAALLGLGLGLGLFRLRRERLLDTDEKGIALSLLLFSMGCVVGAMINGESLTVPAHYHGTVGAVTLAFMLWLRRSMSDLGVSDVLHGTRRLPNLYGIGIVILVLGLSWAGLIGIPRKATHVEIGALGTTYYLVMGLAGVGGFLALIGATGFVARMLAEILKARGLLAARSRRDMRVPVLTLTILLIVVVGMVLDRLPTQGGGAAFSPASHADAKRKAEINLRFEQGVVMLHAKEYEHAMTAFHRVVQLAPQMPEAYVNLGFALLGQKKYKEARDFFDSATLIRKEQANAYYGMAVAYEGMNDLPAALGAMQTYVHLAKPDDRYRTKAESAIWEWRKTLQDQAEAEGRKSK